MTNIVARKYVSALTKTYAESELDGVMVALAKIANSLVIQKLRFILVSKEVTHTQKCELLLEISERANDTKFANFVKILVDKQKIEFVASMAEEIRKYLASRKGSVNGIITANFQVTDEIKSSLEKSLSHKLSKNVQLSIDEKPAHNFDGIRVDLEDISVEVEIEKNTLKNAIIEHVLKSDKIL